MATAKDGMGNVLQVQGRYREAIAAFEESLRWADRAGDGQSRAYITFASPADYDCFMRAIFIIDGDEPTPEQLCAVNTLGGGWNVRLRSHATGATCADGTPELAHVPAVYFPHRHVATLAPRLRSSTARLGSGRAKRD